MNTPTRKLWLAAPRGFCAGVDRAIDIVDMALQVYGAPIYVRHEIVHNRHVVEDLRRKGAVFTDDLSEVPEGSVVIFSAHGVSPAVRAEASARGLRALDATCPLVTKVHLEALRHARAGYSLVLVGHRQHVEVIGTLGARAYLIEGPEDIRAEWLVGHVGLTAGASTPERVVQACVARVCELGTFKVEPFTLVEERIMFPLPNELLVDAQRKGIAVGA